MHGESELIGDKVQLCALKIYPEKAMDLLVCVSEDFRAIPGNTEKCALRTGLDYNLLRTCFEGPEGTALIEESAEIARTKGAVGSPTVYIGGSEYQGGRSTLQLLSALCGQFTAKPEVCGMLPKPVELTATILTDSRCVSCKQSVSQYETALKEQISGVTVRTLDYGTEEGKALYQSAGLEGVPAILFEKQLADSEACLMLESWLLARGDRAQLVVEPEFDPTSEICDNKIDDTGNGKIDCSDPTCESTTVCRQERPGQLDLFAMSQCPYGATAFLGLRKILNHFGNSINLNIYYIADDTGNGVSSMHGQSEVDENIRQLCAIKHYSEKYAYLSYLECRSKDYRSENWEVCTGDEIKKEVIEECFKSEGMALLKENIKMARQLSIGGSPTWMANNKFQFHGIDPANIVGEFCGFNPKQKGCEVPFDTSVEPPSIPDQQCE